jgi:hypothetical protein
MEKPREGGNKMRKGHNEEVAVWGEQTENMRVPDTINNWTGVAPKRKEG